MVQIKIKRVYEPAMPEDGYRVLVDRLWPRGCKKEALKLDEWNKQIAPSAALRKFFNHDKEYFELFKMRYKDELELQHSELLRLLSLAEKRPVTLLYAAKEGMVNHAIVLYEVLQSLVNKVK